MQLSWLKLAIFAAGLASAVAAPAPGPMLTSGDPSIVAGGTNQCGESDFFSETTAGSPAVDDCLQIVKNIKATLGLWQVEMIVRQQHQLLQSGTCAFGVRSLSGIGMAFRIGAKDITDLIEDAVRQFAWNGLVGARGTMHCNTGPYVEWGLYHNQE